MLVAAGPLVEKLGLSSAVPEIVEITPSAVTRRTSQSLVSAMRNPPSGVAATRVGRERQALVAGPPSPQYPSRPLPATVEILPSGVTRRTRSWKGCAIYRLPSRPRERPWGWKTAAARADPPSPRPSGGL